MMSDLGHLAVVINKRHHEVEDAEAAYLESAIAAGVALLEAHAAVEPGRWVQWVKDNLDFSYGTAKQYMRFGLYGDRIREANVTLYREALEVVRSMPDRPTGGISESFKTPHLVSTVKRLRASGMSWYAIGNELGFDKSTIRSWVDPEFKQAWFARVRANDSARKQRRTALRVAAKQVERDELASTKGGSAANAYSFLRRALAELDRALGDADDPAVKASLREAMSHAHRAEDDVVAALRGKELADRSA